MTESTSNNNEGQEASQEPLAVVLSAISRSQVVLGKLTASEIDDDEALTELLGILDDKDLIKAVHQLNGQA